MWWSGVLIGKSFIVYVANGILLTDEFLLFLIGLLEIPVRTCSSYVWQWKELKSWYIREMMVEHIDLNNTPNILPFIP